MEPRSPRRRWSTAALLCASALAAPPAAAAPGDAEAERLVKTAGAYLAVWDVDGRAACEERRPACEHMEEMLDRAARGLEDARRSGSAILVFQTLLDPRYHLDHTDRARLAPYEIGTAYRAIGAYAEAATLFERFAEEREALDQAPPALEEATRLRLRLGDRDKAIADAVLFQRLYARKQPERSSRITLAIAARDEQEEDWEAEGALLTAAMPALDRSSLLEARIEAHLRMGRALSHLGRAQSAAIEMSRVLVIARDRASAAAAMKRRGKEAPPDAATEDAIAEARFAQAEQKREEVLRIKLAPYRGAGDRASVLGYLNTSARLFMTQKEYAILDTERAYARVFGLELPPATPPPPPPPPFSSGMIGLLNSGKGGDPNAPRSPLGEPFSVDWPGPPPSVRWAIAASARVGAFWGDFAVELRALPIPKEWSSGGELRGKYYETLDAVDVVWKQRAKAAFKTCLNYAIKNARFDEFSRSCEAWLAKNYGAEYHTVEELFTGPTWIGPSLLAAPAPAH